MKSSTSTCMLAGEHILRQPNSFYIFFKSLVHIFVTWPQVVKLSRRRSRHCKGTLTLLLSHPNFDFVDALGEIASTAAASTYAQHMIFEQVSPGMWHRHSVICDGKLVMRGMLV